MGRLSGRFAVLGMGRSGLAVVDYLLGQRDQGSPLQIVVYDSGDSESLRDHAERLRSRSVVVELSATAVSGFFDLCVTSPGIPPSTKLFQSALRAAKRVISEIEFAYEHSRSPWVAITGTNGKTTVTSLLTHLLTVGGVKSMAVGNIGNPSIAAVSHAEESMIIVAEVSSFQLAMTERFHPKVAVLLNITPDHLDWHGSFENYVRDKVRLFDNLTEGDVAVIDIDDPLAADFVDPVRSCGARVIAVSRLGFPADGAGLFGGMLCLEVDGGGVELVRSDELQIKGAHNINNALAAAAAAAVLGVDTESIRIGLRNFTPVPHRLQPVGRFGGVDYVNDSKATNPSSTKVAVASFPDYRIVLLLGGRSKGSDFSDLASTLHRTSAVVVAFGEAAPEIHAAMNASGITCTLAQDLRSAVDISIGVAEPGDVVLLSPGCASFDEFEGFAHRGDVFSALVRQRLGENK